MPSSSLLGAFRSGVAWTGLAHYTVQVTQFVTSAVLSRMLSPSDFGVVAMVTVVTSYINLFVDAGVGSAVVQRRDLTQVGLSSLFWLTTSIGILLAGGLAAAAPFVAYFYSFPAVVKITWLVALNLFFAGLTIVPANLLRRSLNFRLLAIIDIGSAIGSASLAIVLAARGWGYWALAVQVVAAAGLRTLLVLVLSGWRPRWEFDRGGVRSVLGYSLYVMAFNSVNYWARNADNLLVGRFLGAEALGYYHHAYSLMMVPLRVLTTVINPVLHPVLAMLQAERRMQADAYLRVVRGVALVSVPLAVGMWVVAEPLVLVVWGPGWEPVIPVFRILGLLAAIQPVVSTTGAVFMARNRTNWFFWLGLVNAGVIVAGIAVGLHWGITGVAWGYATSYAIVAVPTMVLVLRSLLGVSFRTVVRQFKGAVGCGLLVGSVMLLGSQLISKSWGPALQLIGSAIAGGVALGAGIQLFDRGFVRLLVGPVASSFVGRRSNAT